MGNVLRHTLSTREDSDDKWPPYRLTPAQLPQRVLEVLEVLEKLERTGR